MSFILRPPQQITMDQTRDELSRVRAVLISAECGYGKGVIYGKIVENSRTKRKADGSPIYVLFIVYGRDRVNDFHERLTKISIEHGVIMGDHKRERHHHTQVASVSTLFRMKHKPLADLIIIDEAHLGLSPTFRAVLDFYPTARIIGCTATPMLGNGKALGAKSGGIFESMVRGPSVNELIKDNYLVGSVVMAPDAPKDLAGLRKKKNGEVDGEQGASICDNAKVIGDVVDHWKRYASDRKAVSFAFNQKHAFDIAESFRAAGVNFAYIDANTPDGDIHTPGTRKFLMHNYDHGDLVGISSCQTISIGWDHSIAKVLLLCGFTYSFPLYRQRLGRGSRLHKGYDHFRVHDHVGNLYEFLEQGPYFESEVDWQLDGDPVRVSDEDKARRVRTCNVPVVLPDEGPTIGFRGPIENGYMLPCLTPFSPGPQRCPHCGIPIVTKGREIEQEDGELVEITPEVREKSIAQQNHERRMRDRYLELAMTGAKRRKANGDPYSLQWPMVQFKNEFRQWPKKEWKMEARGLIAELSDGVVPAEYELRG